MNPKDKIATTKVDISVIPPVAILHEAHALMDGDYKYGAFNWRGEPVQARVYVGATLRHMLAWLDGEECAGDSQVHHLGHARACCAILLDAQAQGTLIDDRPVNGKCSIVMAELHAKIKEKRSKCEPDITRPQSTLLRIISANIVSWIRRMKNG